jgi:hypothetical protein
MKEYYIAQNDEKKGPFSLKDLKHETVLPETLIWKEGWPEWKQAKDAVQEVPSIELIINDEVSTPSIPQQEPKKKEKPNMLMTAAKLAEGDLESIGSLFNSSKAKDDQAAEGQKPEDKPSFVGMFYAFCGEHIDIFLTKNSSKIGSNFFYTKLNKAREYYKALSPVRQKSASFMVSYFLFILFVLLVSVISGSFFSEPLGMILTALLFSMTFASYVALYEVKFVDKPITKVTNAVIFFTLGFLPNFIKKIIVQIVKFLIFTIIVFFLNFVIGPVYIAFRLVIAFVNPKDMPSFDRYG